MLTNTHIRWCCNSTYCWDNSSINILMVQLTICLVIPYLYYTNVLNKLQAPACCPDVLHGGFKCCTAKKMYSKISLQCNFHKIITFQLIVIVNLNKLCKLMNSWWDLKFSQDKYRLWTSVLWHQAVLYEITTVLEKPTASTSTWMQQTSLK
jgi:hypothetical protein